MRTDSVDEQIAFIEALEAAQLNGVAASTVSAGGRTVTYHSLNQLSALLERERARLNQMQYPEQGRATSSLANFTGYRG